MTRAWVATHVLSGAFVTHWAEHQYPLGDQELGPPAAEQRRLRATAIFQAPSNESDQSGGASADAAHEQDARGGGNNHWPV